jgi:hypothetical protein
VAGTERTLGDKMKRKKVTYTDDKGEVTFFKPIIKKKEKYGYKVVVTVEAENPAEAMDIVKNRIPEALTIKAYKWHTEVSPTVVKLVESVGGGEPFEIGDIVEHPKQGKVKITDGQYWGTYGVSNFWYWKKVMPDGTLSKKTYHGYGWR